MGGRGWRCRRQRRRLRRWIRGCSVFWLAVLYIVVRLILDDSKAVLLAYYASLRLF
jgi:hypothetical protein